LLTLNCTKVIGLEKIKRQAEREDGQLLILPSFKEEVGALSDPTHDLSYEGKGTDIYIKDMTPILKS
jgi:hypothetical protein